MNPDPTLLAMNVRNKVERRCRIVNVRSKIVYKSYQHASFQGEEALRWRQSRAAVVGGFESEAARQARLMREEIMRNRREGAERLERAMAGQAEYLLTRDASIDWVEVLLACLALGVVGLVIYGIFWR